MTVFSVTSTHNIVAFIRASTGKILLLLS